MFYVYVLRSQKNGHLYKGQTSDISKRLEMHNSGLVRYTKRYLPWVLVYHEIYTTRAEAMQREAYLKTGAGRDWLQRKLKEFDDAADHQAASDVNS